MLSSKILCITSGCGKVTHFATYNQFISNKCKQESETCKCCTTIVHRSNSGAKTMFNNSYDVDIFIISYKKHNSSLNTPQHQMQLNGNMQSFRGSQPLPCIIMSPETDIINLRKPFHKNKRGISLIHSALSKTMAKKAVLRSWRWKRLHSLTFFPVSLNQSTAIKFSLNISQGLRLR